jgi:hypothetical protein
MALGHRATRPLRLYNNDEHAYCHSTPVSQYTLLEGRAGALETVSHLGMLPSWPCQFYDIFFLIPQKSPFFADAVYGSPFTGGHLVAMYDFISGSRTWVGWESPGGSLIRALSEAHLESIPLKLSNFPDPSRGSSRRSHSKDS